MARLKVSLLLAAMLLAAMGVGCGAPALCASSTECGPERVCGLAGHCTPLDAPESARFAGSRWLTARDWGQSSSDARERGDVLVLGGPARGEALLAFGPLPGRSRILRALFVLHPHDALARVERPGQLVVEQVEPFRGGRMPPRASPGAIELAIARRVLPSGPARPARFDVTAAAQGSAARRDRTLHVLVRILDGDAAGASFSSPWALGENVQPRLELLLH